MAQGKHIEVLDYQFEKMLISAFRYCLERNTGLGFEVNIWLKNHWKDLPREYRKQIIGDINHRLDSDMIRREDVDVWKSILELVND